MSQMHLACRPFGRAAKAALIAALACLGLAFGARALECPTPQKLPLPGVLKETPAQIDQIASSLASGAVDVKLKAIISDLRARYPKIENAEIANYLITAYCPVAASQAGASEGEKKLRMDQFVSLVMGMLY